MSQQRMVDRNSMRGGAAVSVVVLLVSYVFQFSWGVVAVAVALGMGSIFGPKTSPLGITYRFIKKALRLQIPVEPEEEAPPRFAQTLGFIVLSLAVLAFIVAGSASVLGWIATLAVAALQALLASTGLCVGCEIYLYTKRFAAKGA